MLANKYWLPEVNGGGKEGFYDNNEPWRAPVRERWRAGYYQQIQHDVPSVAAINTDDIAPTLVCHQGTGYSSIKTHGKWALTWTIMREYWVPEKLLENTQNPSQFSENCIRLVTSRIL